MQGEINISTVSGEVVNITALGFVSSNRPSTHTHAHKKNPASFQRVETMQTAFSHSLTTV